MKRNREEKEKDEVVRVELKYCERCGGLWLRECATGAVYCEKCQGSISDLPIPKKKPQRVELPVRRRVVLDELAIEDSKDDSLDCEAAGGVA
jgi:Zn-finger nucleic acid-binding protein